MNDIEALWLLGLIDSRDLSSVANEAMNHGFESKSLVELAISSPLTSLDDAKRLFQKSLEELGRGKMSKEDALRRYAKIVSNQIIGSSLSPFEGAKLIWQATLSTEIQNFHDLDPFIYAASEFEDRPKDRSFFEKAIVTEAKRWNDIDNSGGN